MGIRIVLFMMLAGCGASGPRAELAASAPVEIAEGSRVLVTWDATAALWPATVLSVHDTVARVRFDADGSEHFVARERIVGLAPDVPAAVPTTQPDAPVTDDAPRPDPASLVLFGVRDVLAPARAVRCDDGIVVVFADGEARAVPFDDVRTQPLAPGDAVMAHYQGGETTYAATVLTVAGERVSVRYEDGSEEELPIRHIGSAMRAQAPQATTGRVPPLCRELGGDAVPWVWVLRGRVAEIGSLAACDGDEAQVRLHDGSIRAMPRAQITRAEIAPGARVWAPWGETLYAATVTAVDGAMADIQWEDESTDRKHLGELRRIELAADFRAAAAGCPE